jgi:cysteine desulfurase/selenocysteine lyase
MNRDQVLKLRADTIGCKHVLHLNNAGASLPPASVVNAVKNHLDLEEMIGGYEAAEAAASKIEKMYVNAAKLIHCQRDEIAFMENATVAWDMAFYSFQFQPGDRILTCSAEYASNYLALLQVAKNKGVIIDIINNDNHGQLDVTDLRNRITNKVKLIAITHIPSQGGLINPVEHVGVIAKQANIPYLLDATQSVGQLPIDVDNIGCDLLCATGRKYLRAPRGTGFLYVRKNILNQPPFINSHSANWITDATYTVKSDASRFESKEHSIAAKIGLGVAIDYALNIGIDNIWERIQRLATQLRHELSKIAEIELCDLGENKCGIITFSNKLIPTDKIKSLLHERNINVSIASAEYSRLDFAKRNISSLVRCSVHYYNTEEEISRFCHELKNIFIIYTQSV